MFICPILYTSVPFLERDFYEVLNLENYPDLHLRFEEAIIKLLGLNL